MADLNAIFYVSGMLVKLEMDMRRNCASCKNLLVMDGSIEVAFEEEFQQFFQSLNRSGLLRPSEAMFTLVTRLWELCTAVEQNKRSLNAVGFKLYLSLALLYKETFKGIRYFCKS